MHDGAIMVDWWAALHMWFLALDGISRAKDLSENDLRGFKSRTLTFMLY